MLKDPQRSTQKSFPEMIREYEEKEYITLSEGTNVSIKVGILSEENGRENFEYIPITDSFILPKEYRTIPKIINPNDSSINGFGLVSEEYLRKKSLAGQLKTLTSRMGGDIRKSTLEMSERYYKEAENLYKEFIIEFLKENDLLGDLEVNSIDDLTMYIVEEEI